MYTGKGCLGVLVWGCFLQLIHFVSQPTVIKGKKSPQIPWLWWHEVGWLMELWEHFSTTSLVLLSSLYSLQYTSRVGWSQITEFVFNNYSISPREWRQNVTRNRNKILQLAFSYFNRVSYSVAQNHSQDRIYKETKYTNMGCVGQYGVYGGRVGLHACVCGGGAVAYCQI